MKTMWIGGPYHGEPSEQPISGNGQHTVVGSHGPHHYVQFLVLGHVLFCRHEAISDAEATRLVAAVRR